MDNWQNAIHTVYLVHIVNAVNGHAAHYIGIAKDLWEKMHVHISDRKRGSSLLWHVSNVLHQDWAVVRTWPGNWHLEMQLKGRHNTGHMCPVCNHSFAANASDSYVQKWLAAKGFITLDELRNDERFRASKDGLVLSGQKSSGPYIHMQF